MPTRLTGQLLTAARFAPFEGRRTILVATWMNGPSIFTFTDAELRIMQQ